MPFSHVRWFGAFAPALLGLCHQAWSEELPRLEPYQLVRSLQIIQDRIAGGDEAALALQGKVIVMTDTALQEASPEQAGDLKNLKALITYGLSGGNPETVVSIVPVIPDDHPLYHLAQGVAGYVSGRQTDARISLAKVDPLTLDPDIAAYVALAKGNANVDHDLDLAVASLTQARLLGPGTLVEEAALRRLMALHLKSGDVPAFMRSALDYARRFITSPYANQFAEMFVSGVIGMKGSVTKSQIKIIADAMPVVFRHSIYLKIARRAAIRGELQLSEFAASMIGGQIKNVNEQSSNAERTDDQRGGDPARLRSSFYSRISAIAGSGSVETLDALNGIDSAKLPPEDRKLLVAARAVAEAVVEPILDQPMDEFEKPQSGISDKDESPGNSEVEQTSEIAEADQLLERTRERLGEIDALLEEVEQ